MGGFLAAEYLLSLGHKKLGILINTEHSNTGSFRFMGYQKAMRKYKLLSSDYCLIQTDFTFNDGYKNSLELLENKEITGVLAGNDLIALGVKKRATEMNLAIPEDVSIIGYDNSSIGTMLNSSLTTIDQDIETLISCLVDFLIDRLKSDSISKKSFILKPTLVIGKSASYPKNN